MVVSEIYIGKDLHLVKNIVNEFSNKYDNFSNFVVGDNSISKYSSLYLYFNDGDLIKNNEKICVEHLKGVHYNNIKEVIKNSSIDFDGYVGCNIIRNIDKDWLSDIFLTYKVKDFNGDLNLKYIREISSSWSARSIYQLVEDFEFYNYLGRDFHESYREKYNVGWGLMFKYATDHIMISKNYYKDNEENLFKLSFEEGEKINITKFVNENESFYGSPVSEFKYKEINAADMMLFVIDLINVVECELKIKISKPTFKYFEAKLIDHFKHLKKSRKELK